MLGGTTNEDGMTQKKVEGKRGKGETRGKRCRGKGWEKTGLGKGRMVQRRPDKVYSTSTNVRGLEGKERESKNVVKRLGHDTGVG